METTVKCISMAFSRNGKYLVMIGGVPDFKITIYDVEQNKKLVMPETKLPCKPDEFLEVKFNPANPNEFCILSQTVLYSYFIHPAYDVTDKEELKILGESYRFEVKEFRDEDLDLQFIKFVWDPFNRIHICTNRPKVVQIDPKFMKVEHTLNLPHRVACVTLTQCHMIVSMEEGLVQWFKLELPPDIVGS